MVRRLFMTRVTFFAGGRTTSLGMAGLIQRKRAINKLVKSIPLPAMIQAGNEKIVSNDIIEVP
ncbi:hypothetical protein O9929_22370 [Vibrio lentus]|nr:hypothetical protein [Vibrio lentus]